MSSKHTPGPWVVGEYSDTLGYDCMFGGIRVGPVTLDGSDYGQHSCSDIEPEALERMRADARLIGASPKLLSVLTSIRGWMIPGMNWTDEIGAALRAAADAAIAEAEGLS